MTFLPVNHRLARRNDLPGDALSELRSDCPLNLHPGTAHVAWANPLRSSRNSRHYIGARHKSWSLTSRPAEYRRLRIKHRTAWPKLSLANAGPKPQRSVLVWCAQPELRSCVCSCRRVSSSRLYLFRAEDKEHDASTSRGNEGSRLFLQVSGARKGNHGTDRDF